MSDRREPPEADDPGRAARQPEQHGGRGDSPKPPRRNDGRRLVHSRRGVELRPPEANAYRTPRYTTLICRIRTR